MAAGCSSSGGATRGGGSGGGGSGGRTGAHASGLPLPPGDGGQAKPSGAPGNLTVLDWYNPVAITDVTASMAYAKSLGDVWSDSVVHVAAYWIGQKLLATAVPASAGTRQTWSWTLPPNFPPGRYVRVTLTGGTPTQAGVPLAWDDNGYYEVARTPAS